MLAESAHSGKTFGPHSEANEAVGPSPRDDAIAWFLRCFPSWKVPAAWYFRPIDRTQSKRLFWRGRSGKARKQPRGRGVYPL